MGKMQFFKDAKVSTGTYTDKNGQEKKRYTKIGALFQNPETGTMSLKLDVLPLPNAQGDIWIAFFDPYEERKQQAQPNNNQQAGNQNIPPAFQNTPQNQPQQAFQQPVYQNEQGNDIPVGDDEIPF